MKLSKEGKRKYARQFVEDFMKKLKETSSYGEVVEMISDELRIRLDDYLDGLTYEEDEDEDD